MMHRLRGASSACMGWLAERGVPRPLRGLVYGGYCRITGADASEAELARSDYPSLGAFFVRRLKAGARVLGPDAAELASPCDGTIQARDRVEQGSLLQAKGQGYALSELLGGVAPVPAGSWAWTIYLSPRDYHRVHCPVDARLSEVRWIPGLRYSVAPGVLARTPRVLARNERAVLVLDGPAGRLYLVMVGALNVGRIRVVGVAPGTSPLGTPAFARGAELARFEMGSTVVLIAPGYEARPELGPGASVRLFQPLARRP